MKKFKAKRKQLLLLGILTLSSVLLWNCEKEYELHEEKEIQVERKVETVSFEEAKKVFGSPKGKERREMKKGLVVTPVWGTLKHEPIAYADAKLTSVDVKLNKEGNYLSKLLFVKVDEAVRSVIFTVITKQKDTKGNILNGTMYFNYLNGELIEGYQIKNGVFTNRLIPRKSPKIYEANFLAALMFFQNHIEDNTFWCDGAEGGCLDTVDLGTLNGGGGGTSFTGGGGLFTGGSGVSEHGSGGGPLGGIPSSGGGAINSGNASSVGGTILTFPPVESDLNGNCPEGYTKNFSTGGCDYKCANGKIYNAKTKKCECPEGEKEDSSGNCVKDCDTTKEDLKKIYPSVSDSKLKEIADAINSYGKDFDIDTKEELRHFLAQAGHESAKMTAFEENLNYRWKKLGINYWKKYFNPHTDGDKDSTKVDPKDYKRSTTSSFVKKEKFANYVYNDDNRDSSHKLGNTSEGDGYKYRGRGIIQLTGKANYEKFNTFYKGEYDNTKDLVTNPDLVKTDMKIAVISALWFFKNNVMNKLTINSSTTVKAVTKKVNGGVNGLSDRKELYNKAKTNINCK
ncbi:putative chitinase [Tenacibaculum sp. 190524A02b]|uniref:Chitinase n=1 Tax=Tenacibaculum vairaonense TaxID=3137860 RepID=A0ABM9PQA1_9FLAO